MAAPLNIGNVPFTTQSMPGGDIPPHTEQHESVYDPESDASFSRQKFETYFELRDRAIEVRKLDGEALTAVQDDVLENFVVQEGHLELPETLEGRKAYYTEFSEAMARAKILGLVQYLEEHHSDKVSAVELEATRAFVESTFSMYGDRRPDGRPMSDANGTFAFVVPARMGREHHDYGQEVEPAIPAFRYLPNEVRAQMMVGLPPFVIDMYQEGSQGRGYLVFAPVFEDMMSDMLTADPSKIADSIGLLKQAAIDNVNAAVNFAYDRFGTRVVGLGATLPAITRYGTKVTNPNVITTTGHAGTIELVRKTIISSIGELELKSIGILGAGAIGRPMAEIIAHEYPDAAMHIYDPRKEYRDRLVSKGPQFVGMDNEKAVLESSQVVVSAISGKALGLKNLGVKSLKGVVIIDDSAPGAISPEEAEELGGSVVWVIGRDVNGNVATRRGYDYGTMVDPNSDVFGCEAEAASLAKYMGELIEIGVSEEFALAATRQLAVRERVTVEHVRRIGRLFTRYSIDPSQPQAFGRLVSLPAHS